MKSRLLSFLALLFLASFVPTTSVKASHAAGGEIIYEHIDTNKYRVFFKFYRDCGGATQPGTQQLCYYSSCDPTIRSAFMNPWPGQIPPGIPNGSAVTLGCSGASTECDNPPNANIPGVQEWWYYTIVELDHQCNFWTFSTAINARNGSNNITCVDFYVETTFNNAYAQGNSSPYFDAKPIPYTCQNMPYSFNNQAIDPNGGDSLWTEVINPLNGTCGSTPTNCGLNLAATPAINFTNNPFQTNNSFNLNGFTGGMNFTATDIGPQTLAIRVKEYRNGVLIGSILRDVQVQVLDPSLCNYTPSAINPAVTIDSAIFTGGQVQGCVKQQMKFCFDIATTDPVGVLIVNDNSKIMNQLAGMNVTYSGQRTKSIRGCVTWTPTANQTGLRNLIIGVKDSTCHPPGIIFMQAFTIPIFVHPAVTALKDTSICPGDKIQLIATGGGNYQWTEIGGGGTMSCTNCPAPIITPFGSMKYAVASQQTNFCKHHKDTVDIVMLEVPKHDNMPDTITCPGTIIPYNLNVIKTAGVTYTVTWSPSTYLNNPSIENPISTPINDVEYHIVVSASNNRCKSYDTARVTLLDGFKIETPDSAICEGEIINLRAKGDAAYTYNWSTEPAASISFGDATQLYTTATPDPLQKPKGLMRFKLVASRAGCTDSIAYVNIDIQPIPTVEVGADQTICYGDTMTLHSTITPTDYPKYNLVWTPGAALSNPNSKNPLFSAFNDATMKLTVSTPAGCSGVDSMKMDVLPSDFMTLTGDAAICPGKTAQIKMTGVDLDSFWWDGNSPYMNNLKSKNPIVKPVATQTYTVYGIDINGCKDTQKITIVVNPAAVVLLPDSITIYPNEPIKLNPSGNALHYSWFPPVGLSRADIADPVVSPLVNTRYFVTAKTEAGCEAKDSINILVSDDTYLNMPNAFSPGNGNNGMFKILRLGTAKLSNFVVYNRWGVKMFETNDINKGWDGRYNGEAQPMGVYMYTVEAATLTGRKFTRNGNVTLIR